jgi:hypothetical protein
MRSLSSTWAVVSCGRDAVVSVGASSAVARMTSLVCSRESSMGMLGSWVSFSSRRDPER